MWQTLWTILSIALRKCEVWNLELAGWLTWQQTQHLPPRIKRSPILQKQFSYSKALACFLLHGTFIVPGHLVECDRFTLDHMSKTAQDVTFQYISLDSNIYQLSIISHNFPSYFFQEPTWLLAPLVQSWSHLARLPIWRIQHLRLGFAAGEDSVPCHYIHSPFSDCLLKVSQQKY